MKLKYNLSKIMTPGLFLCVLVLSTSCEKYVELDSPVNQIASVDAFASDVSATSAVLALYNYNGMSAFEQGIAIYGGVSSDEMHYTLLSSPPDIQDMENNNIATINITNNGFWRYPFSVLAEVNQALDGLTSSTTLSAATKSQLLGETKFFRAFINFYLVSFYGGVPLVNGTDALANGYLPRSSATQVWAQVLSDLKDAQSLLPVTYTGTLRARVNKMAATALLARVYLYLKDYPNAEAQATQVIGSGTYSLAATNSVFLNNSNETILQFATYNGNSALVGYYRTFSSAGNVAPPPYVLTNSVANAFETGDNRKSNWIDFTIYNATTFYRINKYKAYASTAASPGNEYNVVLRLAEQYLIRAEARVVQNNLQGAADDLNVIRARAGLTNLQATTVASQSLLTAAVAQERRVELFGEFGHRWLDLIRTGQANTVLGAFKPTTWKSTAVLFPIPDQQIQLNSSLIQNPGYK